MESSTEAFRFLTNFRKVRLTTLEYFVLEIAAQKKKKTVRWTENSLTKLLKEKQKHAQRLRL